uniref:Uncharacterized protein n=1 Tax=Utricularia reniformis TaxID=192314 RepID=A0A1Y0AZN2_9LAMI|nr:hypothetical protein AEK19_MT0313 [Utricularia reniformis]ART30588.1 hypothetical protein AEK19_MT0313 [Utricularia reniformis]
MKVRRLGRIEGPFFPGTNTAYFASALPEKSFILKEMNCLPAETYIDLLSKSPIRIEKEIKERSMLFSASISGLIEEGRAYERFRNDTLFSLILCLLRKKIKEEEFWYFNRGRLGPASFFSWSRE